MKPNPTLLLKEVPKVNNICGKYFSSKTNPVYIKKKELQVVQA